MPGVALPALDTSGGFSAVYRDVHSKTTRKGLLVPDSPPPNRTLNATDVRAHWSQVLLEVFQHKACVVVEKSGIPVAAIIAADELERLRQIDQERRERFKALDASWEAFRHVDVGDIETEVAKAVTEARADIRAEREAASARGA